MEQVSEITVPIDFLPLPRSFFLHSPQQVARGLIGQLLCRKTEDGVAVARIVETEAYLGSEDPAAHAYRGQTARNAVLFGPAGFAYVYFIYGRYFCLNVSCEAEGKAGCVLFRAVEPLPELANGIAWLRSQRSIAGGLPLEALPPAFANGPSRLCQAFGITRTEHNGLDLTCSDSGLWLAKGPGLQPGEHIAKGPRIGIRNNADALLRFFLQGHPHVSSPRSKTTLTTSPNLPRARR